MEGFLWIFSQCLLLGIVVGFIAGLLGIGGGLIIVPALLYLLPAMGVNVPQLPHIAIATSLAAIILTSFSSARAHYKRENIDFHIFGKVLPGILIGALMSGFIAELIPAHRLQQVFAIFVVLMAIQMVFPIKPETNQQLPSRSVLFVITLIIAIVAGLMGIGGGVLLVPFLSLCGMQMRYAVGVSSVVGLFIALCGSLGYIVAGWNTLGLPQWTLGYVYLPALAGIVMTSIFVAPLGVKAASVWPTSVLKKIFSALLVMIGIKLIFS